MGLLDLIFACLASYTFWLLLLITYFVKRYLTARKYNLPPRPDSLPIIGNMHRMFYSKQGVLYKWCQDVSRRVGPVVRVTFGPFDTVVLNDMDSIQEAMVDRGMDITGRIKMHLLEILTDNYSGIVISDADHPTWGIRRKLLATALRNFSIGRPYEQRVSETLNRLVEHLDKLADKGEAFDPRDYCKLATFNFIANVLFQKGFAFDDEEFVAITTIFQETNELFSGPISLLIECIPFVRKLPFDLFDVKAARRLKEKLLGMIEREMKICRQRGEETGEIGDLAYYVLKTREEGAKERFNDVTDLQVLHILNDVFTAGSDTTQLSLRWLLVCLASDQDIQNKVYDEITDNVPESDEALVSAIDYKSQMPYSEAVLLESTRFATVVIMGVPHKALVDTKVKGYDIPKGTAVVLNHWAVNHDEKNFENPEKFIPERFLDENGKVGPRPKGYFPFGIGRRACPGETTARTTLWMLYVSLVKRYRILPPEGETLKPEHNAEITGNAIDGQPRPFKIRLVRR